MTFGRMAALVGVALLVMAANVAATFAYMVVYSYAIDRGHDEQYYRDHVAIAAPYCSIVAGIPLMFLAGRWIAGWWDGALGIRTAVTIWVAYAVVDTAVLAASGMTTRLAVLAAVSMLTKLAAVYLGAVSAARV